MIQTRRIDANLVIASIRTTLAAAGSMRSTDIEGTFTFLKRCYGNVTVAIAETEENSGLPFVPIVLVTAKADSKDVVAGLEAGADGMGPT
jgi:hypothetical protein